MYIISDLIHGLVQCLVRPLITETNLESVQQPELNKESKSSPSSSASITVTGKLMLLQTNESP